MRSLMRIEWNIIISKLHFSCSDIMRYHFNLYDLCQNMAGFILFWGTLQFFTFRVNKEEGFALSAMAKEALNLFRLLSCRFLQNKTVTPLINFKLCGIGNNLQLRTFFFNISHSLGSLLSFIAKCGKSPLRSSLFSL